ncbi:glycosyltransferase [Lactiplantibacillus plantarum]|uniref:glycosyltransferase n=1 Tax=Lactiplantibacillus plantarum TaxID=1590 RepID=UPI0007881E63|nr:glycosyltransferase [Lactiplantibacillus plantarum]ASX21136.1 hypothetical protein BGV74_04810 [Lactiplantibacillus plantarum]KYK51886.1 hypothetical protein AYO51_06280 [Lactiplantibacillus plantarum]KYM69370.1 hypothetical protein AZJ01_12095 [Lactiplantibacillus plantarum]KZE02530.1 glycosyltransferase [Lactiplantibacillus plantarum]MBE1726928.1 glycosyltransferase [Lactiplantibacillus plantarum]
MKYASVIVTYNRKELLVSAVNALLKQTIAPKKIVIVDNHSTDGTEEVVRQAGLMNNDLIRYVRLPENVGGSGGFNIGVKIALEYDVDWISLSDDDAVFHTDYFNQIQVAIVKYPNIKAFSGTIKLPDGRIQVDQRNRITNWNHLKAKPVSRDEYDHDFNIDLFTFCGCVINASTIKKIGLPYHNYFIWYDDIEYSLRIRECTEIMNVSDSILVHHTHWGGADSGYRPDWREYYGIRNRVVTVNKRGKNRLSVMIWLLLFLPIMMIRVFSKPFYIGYRWHAFYVNSIAYRDAIIGKMGKNLKFLPK